jgi:hypothetical protein
MTTGRAVVAAGRPRWKVGGDSDSISANGPPAFYNVGVEERVPGERARWLAAVLIVTSIAAASVVVQLWPARTPAAALLAARPLLLVTAPAVPIPGAVSRVHVHVPAAGATVHETEIAFEPAAVPAVAAVIVPEEDIEAVQEIVQPPHSVEPVLASRSLPLFAAAPSTADVEALSEAPEESRPFVELPIIAAARVVTVAGRGIRSGLRLTGAAVRAAF